MSGRSDLVRELRRIAHEIEVGVALAEQAPPVVRQDLVQRAMASARVDARTVRRAAALIEADGTT